MAGVSWILTVLVAFFTLWPSCHGYLIPTGTAGKMLSTPEMILGRRPIATRRITLMGSAPETITVTRLAADEDDSNQVIQEPNNNSTNNNNDEDGDDEKSDKRGKLGRFWRRIKDLFSTKSSDSVDNAVDDPATSNTIPQNGAAVGNVILSENNDVSSQEDQNTTILPSQPEGTRWAISSNSTNLSGLWKPIVTPEFKKQYDEYLQNCSQPLWFRNLVSNVLGTTREQVQHDNNGRELVLSSKNPAGEWKRTLLASGSDMETTFGVLEPVYAIFQDPDKDSVQVESWWEHQGTVHKSILRGKPRLKGGEFETLRYLEANVDGSARDDIYVVESYFHPSPTRATTTSIGQKFRPGYVKWRFSRVS
jgi:hypothetical protein